MAIRPDSLPGIQQQIAALMRGIPALEAFTPRKLSKSMLELTLQFIAFCQRMATDEENQQAWQEFHNKLLTFYLFEHVDSVLDINFRDDSSLPDLLGEAAALGPYYRVWVTEALGRYYTEWALQTREFLTSLFCSSAGSRLPDFSLVPLHAGMGLSLAELMLSRENNHERATDSFLAACVRNSREGYLEVAYEALGLVTRNLYPQWLDSIHNYLSHKRPDILDYFWHGVGRATYFSPLTFAPRWDSPGAGTQMMACNCPDRPAERNALAGFAWALTLVNIRHPRIIATMLKNHEADLREPEAFKNGVYSSLIIWRESSPGSDAIDALYNYQGETCAADLWEKYVRAPCCLAQQHYQHIKSSKSIGRLFRF